MTSGIGARIATSLALATGLLIAAPAAGAVDVGCAAPAGAFAGGDGTSGAPYEIATDAQLQLLKSDPSYWTSSLILTSDISMLGCIWDSGVGTSASAFSGSFDGNAHTIGDLTVTVTGNFAGDPVGGVAGFFGVLSNGASVTDLSVNGAISAAVSGAQAMAGGIAGIASGADLSNVAFVGTVNASSSGSHPHAGGIAGQALDTTISAARSTALVTAGPTGRANAGGVVGWMSTGGASQVATMVEDSWATGVITADGDSQSSSGGLIGMARPSVSVERSYTDARVIALRADEAAAGGLIGFSQGTIVDSYARGSVVSWMLAGGLIGWSNQVPATNGTAERSYFTGTVTESGWLYGNGVGGAVGGATVSSGAAFESTDTLWDTQTTGTTTGVSAFNGAWSAQSPVSAPGVTGKTSSELTDIATYTGWDIAAGYEPTQVWGICPTYNEGFPFLSGTVDADVCAGVPSASLAPATQTIASSLGDAVATLALGTTGFINTPVYSVTPALPTGLTLDPMTGQITGSVTVLGNGATYTITAMSQGPRQTATSTVVQPASPLLPGQVSTLTTNNPDNGNFATLAVRPSDGSTLAVIYAIVPDGASTRPTLLAYLLDASGNPVGEPTAFVPAGISISASSQPAVAFNPVTGGWLTCFADVVTNQPRTTRPMCLYLNADGSASGAAFAVAGTFTDGSNQNAIAFNPASGRFLVVSTTYSAGAVGQFVDAAGAGVVGSLITFSDHVTTTLDQSGGVDLAYSPTSDTYAVVVRGSDTTEEVAPWVYHLAGTGLPSGEPVRMDPNLSRQITNASVAWSKATDTFMLVAFDQSYSDSNPLITAAFAAPDGSRRGAPVVTPVDSSFIDSRWRPSIASAADASEYAVTAVLSLAGTFTRTINTLVLDAAGTVQSTTFVAGTQTTVIGARPRIAFNATTCTYSTLYSATVPGWSTQAFTASNASLSACLPAVPRGVQATARDAAARVTWQVPSFAGSSPISNYTLKVVEAGRAERVITTPGPQTAYVITGMRNGVRAGVQVAAVTAAGTGPWSDPVFVTPVAPPPPPVPPSDSIHLRGKRGEGPNAGKVAIHGRATGLEGRQVVVLVRFPGDTELVFAARVRVGADGRFEWSRMANRKVTIVVTHADREPARVIIAAR